MERVVTQSKEEALQSKLIQRVLKNPPAYLADCEFRPVVSTDEFLACSKLVHRQYVNRQYMIPHRNELRLDLHQITQKSTTFVALYKKRYLLGTLTLVEDSPLGVPMDKIYKDDLDKVRNEKKHFGEVTMLAVNAGLMQEPTLGFKPADQMIVLLYLFREMLTFARLSAKLDSLVACFHPRHEMFYRAIRFDPLAGLKAYGSVQGSPALAYMLNIEQLDKSAKGVMRFAYGFDLPTYEFLEKSNFYRFKFNEFFEIFTNLDSTA